MNEYLSDNISLFPVVENNSVKLINQDGTIVSKLNFDTASFTHEKYNIIEIDGLFGAVNLNGEISIPVIYTEMHRFSCGLSLVRNSDGFYGYIDIHGNVKIPFIYSYARDFSENLAIVSIEGYPKFQFINTNGEIIWHGTFDALYNWGDFHDGYMVNGNTIYDKNGNQLITNKIQNADVEIRYPGDFSNGLAVIPKFINDFNFYKNENPMGFFEGSNWYNVYIDINGDDVFNNKFTISGRFSEGLAVASDENNSGVIDTMGNFIFHLDNIMPNDKYSEGLLIFRDIDTSNNKIKYGFLDKTGKVAIPAIYEDYVYGFKNGLALVGIDDNLAYINSKGEIIIQFEKPTEHNFYFYVID
jgi:hypothetical protein